MEKIKKNIEVGISREMAFQKFIFELNEWWPIEYTWSQDKLKEIRIDSKLNGLCTEIGPYGFRCDWGRVTGLTNNESISLKWQISAKRHPIPDPDKASDIKINFIHNGNSTSVIFEHYNFEHHGEGSESYREMMDSNQGWDYILDSYRDFCEK